MSNCLSCTNYSSCTACLSAYNLFGGQCLTVCPQGYLSVAISLTNASCSSCPANCLACSSISTCTTCQHSYFLSSGLCVPSCSAPFLPNYLNKCTACECLTCSAYSYNCTACGGILSLQNNQCLTQCLAGYYSSNNMCNACMDNCADCSSATFCSICYLPYLLLYSSPTVSACLSSCPSGTIATINPSNFSYLCAPCDSPCLTCQTNTDQCTSCSSPLLLTNGNCSNSCPSGQFSFGGKCVTCYPECSSCSSSDPTICFSCSGGYFLSATACLSSCPNGTYP
jgi:proprotein convertase subtilisin/kexin type 5